MIISIGEPPGDRSSGAPGDDTIIGPRGEKTPLSVHLDLGAGNKHRRVSGTDSGLEAFSHNPADDSFAPLPDRTGANTNYLNERFLSY